MFQKTARTVKLILKGLEQALTDFQISLIPVLFLIYIYMHIFTNTFATKVYRLDFSAKTYTNLSFYPDL